MDRSYDQGVMSQVNLNPNYQTLMGINPVTGISILQVDSSLSRLSSEQVTQGTSPLRGGSLLYTTGAL